jgi:hypothetical protein
MDKPRQPEQPRRRPKAKTRRKSKSKGKITLSAAKLAAQARNARLSRGALTPETKRRSALNRLEFGLYAESEVLPGESQAEYDENKFIWIEDMRACTVSEVFHASSAADAAWRYRRALRAIDAHATRAVNQSRRAETPDDKEELREAELLGQQLYQQPTEILIRLRKTPAGCDWLRTQWLRLYERVHEDDCFFNSERIRSCFLLGKRLWEVLDDPTLREFYRYLLGGLLALHPECRPIVVQLFRLELPTEEQGYLDDGEFEKRLNHMVATELPATCAEAAELMRGFIARQMAELEARAARLRQQRAEDGKLQTKGASLDGSLTTARRERQVAMYYRRAETAEANARRLRKERLREDESGVSRSESSDPARSGVDGGERPEEQTAQEPPRSEPPAAGGESPAEESGPPADSPAQEAPPAVADASGSAGTLAPERRNGLGGGILPALVLLLLVPLLGGPGREPAPQSQGSRAVALKVGTSAVGRTAAPARQVGRGPIDRVEAHRTGRRSRWASSRRAGIRPRGRMPTVQRTSRGSRWASRRDAAFPVRRGSPDPAVCTTVRSPRAASAGIRRPAVPAPAGSETHAERAAFSLPQLVCPNDPKLGASPEASGESSSRIEAAVKSGLRPRDSPGLRGPPP